MRTCLLLIFCYLAAVAPAVADGTKMRIATKSEIMQHLSGARNAGSSYQISPGRICVHYKSGNSDCVKVFTNGRRLQMIDSAGAREWLD